MFQKASLVERLNFNLSEEKERWLANWIISRRYEIEQNRSDYVSRAKTFLDTYDDYMTNTRGGAWDSASNVKLPLTKIMVNAFRSRLYNIFASEDAVTITPREGFDKELVRRLEKLRQWYIWDYINDHRGIKGVINEICSDIPTVGMAFVMKLWDEKYRKIKDLVDNPDYINQVRLNQELMMMEDQEPSEDKKVDLKPFKEVQKVIKVFEGTRLVTIPFENIYFDSYIPEIADLDFPDIVIVESMVPISILNRKAKQGIYRQEDVDALVAEGYEESSQGKELKETRNAKSGYTDIGEYPSKSSRWVMYAFCRTDVDDDGVDEDIVVTLSRKGKILKKSYLDSVSPSGRRPIVKFDCFTKARQAYSRGIPEEVYAIQQAMDSDYNLRKDCLQLQAMPWGVYRASSSLQNEPIVISPGKFIPVDDTTDIRTMSFNSSALSLAGEDRILWGYAERLTSVSSLSQGLVGDSVGPTRSTSGVISLLRQVEKEFRPIVEHNAQQWKKLELMLIEDLDYKVSLDLKLRVLGASEKDFVLDGKPLDPDVLYKALQVTGGLDFSVNVASIMASDEVRRNEATILLDKLASPSVLQQLGIIGPKALIMALDEWLVAYNRDPNDYISKPKLIEEPLTLEQEIEIIKQGLVPPMALQDDHGIKAKNLQAFMQSEVYQDAKILGLIAGTADEVFIKAIEKHLALLQALQPKSLPNESGNQGVDFSQMLSGTMPQQGGQNANTTTSRDIGDRGSPRKAVGEGGVGEGDTSGTEAS